MKEAYHIWYIQCLLVGSGHVVGRRRASTSTVSNVLEVVRWEEPIDERESQSKSPDRDLRQPTVNH
jgi:hypothetical protein